MLPRAEHDEHPSPGATLRPVNSVGCSLFAQTVAHVANGDVTDLWTLTTFHLDRSSHSPTPGIAEGRHTCSDRKPRARYYWHCRAGLRLLRLGLRIFGGGH